MPENETKVYHYFVSYSYGDDTGLGFGMSHMGTENPISTYADIKNLKNAIEKTGKCGVVILNYHPLEGGTENVDGVCSNQNKTPDSADVL